jgi:glyoxylase-like metal-dependent hydrolase (beta-lactamase superfamily II)
MSRQRLLQARLAVAAQGAHVGRRIEIERSGVELDGLGRRQLGLVISRFVRAVECTDDTVSRKEIAMVHLRQLCAGLAVISASLLCASALHAAAPQIKGQAPGYYRMLLGNFEIVALSDGTVPLDMSKLLTNTTPVRVDELLKRSFLANPVETSVNAFLVNTGTKLVLIDTGSGNLFGPTLGNVVSNLKAAGYQPEQVDEVYITHMHPDHVGGLIAGDKIAFPNAIVRADQREADFWLGQANMDAAPEAAKGFFKGAMASLNPYVAAGKFKPFDGSGDLAPGIKAVSTYGHTRGHTMYVVESKGQKLALLGDLMHVAAVQFVNPAVTIQFDTDPKMAAVQRRKAYADGAKHGFWLAAAHLPFPGIGHIRADGQGYVYVPANYSVPR